MWILFVFLFGMSAYMIYHLCYELIRHFGVGIGWTLFGYYVWPNGGIPPKVLFFLFLDISLRDILPVALIVGGFFYGSAKIKKKYKLVPLSRFSPKAFETVQHISSILGVKTPECYLIKTQEPQAFVFGKKGSPKLVVTDGLLKLPSKQVESVLYHEFGHILHNDASFMTWGETFLAALKIYIPIMVFYEICLSLLDLMNIWSGPPIDSLVVHLLFIAFFLFAIPMGLINSVSRAREFSADAVSRVFLRSSKHLAYALTKISLFNVKTRFPTRLTITRSNSRYTRIKRIFAYFVDTHPSLMRRLMVLTRRDSVDKRANVPSLEGTVWIGLSTAFLTSFIDEFLVATDDFWTVLGLSTPSDGMLWLRTFEALIFPSCLICLFFAVFSLGSFSLKKTSVKSLIPYLESAWKKIALADFVFLLVYIPWTQYLSSPLLGYFGNLPLNMTTGALMPDLFIESCALLIFSSLFLSFAFILLINCIAQLYYDFKSEKGEDD
jgi:Zn-dependent protease with chaperone function